jgi:photosystem II stability/assembly factor-like uncharacterized protein
VRINRILSIAALMLGTLCSASAGVTSMKLIAPNVGWASSGPHSAGTKLFWTTDGGNHWKEITPNSLSISKGSEFERDVPYTPSVPEFMADVFFLDTRRGWELSFATPKKGWMGSNGTWLSTTDGGATWTTLTLGRLEKMTTRFQSRTHRELVSGE